MQPHDTPDICVSGAPLIHLKPNLTLPLWVNPKVLNVWLAYAAALWLILVTEYFTEFLARTER